MNWNQRLTIARERKGLSKTEFWRLVKVSSATSTNWENGTVKSIKGDNLVRVCQVLGITEEWLLHGDASKRKNQQSIGELTDDEYKILMAYRSSDALGKQIIARVAGIGADLGLPD